MSKAARVLSAGLVISLVGVGVLLFLFLTQSGKLTQVSGDLHATKSALAQTSMDVAKAQFDLAKAQTDISQKQNTIQALNLQANDLLGKNEELKRQLLRAMCGKTIDPASIQSVVTNEGLVEPITQVAEADYADTSIASSFKLLWNNSKSAMFYLTWQDRTESQVVASWDDNVSKVIGIYDVGGACYYYLP